MARSDLGGQLQETPTAAAMAVAQDRWGHQIWFIRDLRTWKAHTESTGASSLLGDGRNSNKAKGFGASMNREEAPVLPRGEAEVRFRRMNPKYGPAYYHPDLANQIEQLEMSCVREGEEFGGHAFVRDFWLRFDFVVGASKGTETTYIFAEWSSDGHVHGRPITAEELRKKGASL